MAIRQIITIKEDEDALRQQSREVESFDQRLWQLLDDLAETMKHANGAGLAAPQVGILKRVCVVSVKDGKVHELVNPVVVKESGTITAAEGCLSIPNKQGDVERPAQLTVEARDRHGKKFLLKAKDMLARAVCHELDHLNGILYTDKLGKRITNNE